VVFGTMAATSRSANASNVFLIASPFLLALTNRLALQ